MTAPPPNATRQAVGRSAQALRRAELAQIHIAKAQLGLSEDDYRLLLRTVTGKDSASELDWRGRAALLAHFKQLGFKSGGRNWVKERGAVKDSYSSQQRKILALWHALHQAGHVRSNTEGALMAWVQREFRVDHLRWLNPWQCHSAIEQLKRWLDRPVRSA